MRQDILDGAVATMPVAASVAAYGSALGVLAAQKHLVWQDLLFMNVSVFAGAAQFVMMDMWNHPLPVLEITMTVFIINLRYLLIGASLRDMFEDKGLLHKLFIMHFVTDENWAVTVAARRRGEASTYFLFGGGLSLLVAWTIGTHLGHWLGAAVAQPEVYALDFAFVAVFTALVVSLWQGKQSILPWAVAALLAIVAEYYLSGKWYVLIGGMGGALVAAFCTPASDPSASEEGVCENA